MSIMLKVAGKWSFILLSLLVAGMAQSSGKCVNGQCDGGLLEDSIGLLQKDVKRYMSMPSSSSISVQELVDAELHFTSIQGEADHSDVGGDRMSLSRHNYAPIYAKYLTSFLEAGVVPTVAEVGILTGTGLAMWSRLFPTSQVFGFDRNTSSYQNNVKHMRELGFDDGRVLVTAMDQMQDNRKLLQSVFNSETLGNYAPNVVIDDGFHVPEAGLKTFVSMKPFLAQRFVYFIEDLIRADVEAGQWEPVKKGILEDCPNCQFLMECPGDKDECVAVIHNIEEPPAGVALQDQGEKRMTHATKLKRPDYESMVVNPMPWDALEQPLVQCPPEGEKPPAPSNDAENDLQDAVSIFCKAGLGSFIEFYVDPRFKGNFDRLKGPDGWIEKAFVTYMAMPKKTDPYGAEEDLLVQSVHHFSNFPVVLTNFADRVPAHMTPERFPNLVLMHARKSASSIQKDFNFNKIHSMLFTKVKGGVVLDADEFITRGVNRMMKRAFEETTKAYPYPILPTHWMSRDPESDDMGQFPKSYTFFFEGKETPPKRTMHWGHAHPTWTHYAMPWLARWSSYVLAPEKTGAPAWLKEQPYMADEDLLNVASWADGLTRQWCKFDLPGNGDFQGYIEQTAFGTHGDSTTWTQDQRHHFSVDAKFYPKGTPLMFLTSHDGKEPKKSYTWLNKLWEGSDGMPHGSQKTIFYDGQWFASGQELMKYDPNLKCIA